MRSTKLLLCLLLACIMAGSKGKAQQIPNPIDYSISGGYLSENTLRNFLKRHISMSHLTNYRLSNPNNYNCALQFIKDTEPKMIHGGGSPWGCDAGAFTNLNGYTNNLEMVINDVKDAGRGGDPDIIFLGGISEAGCTELESTPGKINVPIPQWIKNDLATIGVNVEAGAVFFDWRAMNLHDGNTWVAATTSSTGDQALMDLTMPMSKAWIYYWATMLIDAGYEGFKLGQINRLVRDLPYGNAGADPGYANTNKFFDLIRTYAANHTLARQNGTIKLNPTRGFVIIESQHNGIHVNDPSLPNPNTLLFDLNSWPIQVLETQSGSLGGMALPGTEATNGYLTYGDGLGNNHDALEATIQPCDPASEIYNQSKGGWNHLGWPTVANPFFVEMDNSNVGWGPIPPPSHARICHFPWNYDESTWFHLQPQEYQKQWLVYAWHRVKCLDKQGVGYLQMPGIRPVVYPATYTPAYPFNYYWYEFRAWEQSCNPILNPSDHAEYREKKAAGLTSTIRNIWDANDHSHPSSYNGVDLRPYNEWAADFWSPFARQVDAGNGIYEMPSGRKFFGDFNGDGLLDILETAETASPSAWHGWRIFLMNSNAPNGGVPYNVTAPNFTSSWPSSWEKFYIGDFDGDGKDDFMVTADCSLPYWNGNPWYGWKIYTAANNFGLYASGSFPNCGERIYIGDFNGDGKDDYLVSADNSQGITWQGYKIFEVDPSLPNNNNEIYSATWPSWGERFHIGDYDGNGLDDIMVTTDINVNTANVIPGYYVYKTTIDPSGNLAIHNHAYGNWPSWGENIIVGDWNGDGRDDLTAVASGYNGVTWHGSKTYLANDKGNHFIYAFDDVEFGLNNSNQGSYPATRYLPYLGNQIIEYRQSSIHSSSIRTLVPLHCDFNIWSSTKQSQEPENSIGSINSSQLEESSDGVNVYPNPSNNGLFTVKGGIDNTDEDGRIIVADIQGRILVDEKYSGNSQVNLSQYANGVYILTIKTKNGMEQKKLITNK